MSESAHYKGLKGRYLMGGAAAAGGIAYAAGGLTGGWKKEDGSNRSFAESLGSAAKTTALGAGLGLGLTAGLMYAGNLTNLLSTQKAAGLGLNAKAGFNAMGGAAKLTGEQILSTGRQYSRLFNDPAVGSVMKADAERFLADKPHLATKMGRAGEVTKQAGRVVEGAVEHTAGWLSHNWMPHMKGQGGFGDIAGAYAMAGAGVYTGYEAGKHAYEGDIGGAMKAGAIFAAEKYMFMGWKNRAGAIDFVKKAKLADWGALGGTALNAAALARTAAFEGSVYGASFVKTGVSPTGYAAARGMVLGDEAAGLLQHQAVEHLKNINNMSPEHFQKMLNNPDIQSALKTMPGAIHKAKGDVASAKNMFMDMTPAELTERISKGQAAAGKGAAEAGDVSYLAFKGAQKYSGMDTEKLAGYATVAQSTLGKMETQFEGLRSSGRFLKMSENLTSQVDQLHAKFSQVPGFDDAWQKIQGMSEQGMAAQRRKTGTDFGSPYQGPNTSNRVNTSNRERDLRKRMANFERHSIDTGRNRVNPFRQQLERLTGTGRAGKGAAGVRNAQQTQALRRGRESARNRANRVAGDRARMSKMRVEGARQRPVPGSMYAKQKARQQGVMNTAVGRANDREMRRLQKTVSDRDYRQMISGPSGRDRYFGETVPAFNREAIGQFQQKETSMFPWARSTIEKGPGDALNPSVMRDNVTKPMIAGQVAKAKATSTARNTSARATAAEAASKAAGEAEMAGAFASVTSNKGGFLGQMHSTFGAGGEARESKMLGSTITHAGEKMTMGGAIALNAGNPEMLGELGKQFGNMYSRGAGMFDMGASTRVMLNMNKSVMSTNMDMAKGAYRAGSAVTKATLGASIGQIGFAGAIVAGVGVMAAGALGISGQDAANVAGSVHEHMRSMNKPVYGYSELGQSTQGLSFGLHNRRRG